MLAYINWEFLLSLPPIPNTDSITPMISLIAGMYDASFHQLFPFHTSQVHAEGQQFTPISSSEDTTCFTVAATTISQFQTL